MSAASQGVSVQQLAQEIVEAAITKEKKERQDDRSYRREYLFGSPEWAALRGRSPEDIEDDFRDFLRLLDPDGSIQMTEGYSSVLRKLFTNVLVSLDAFNRCQSILSERQRVMCYLHFRKHKTYEEVARETHYGVRTVKYEIKNAIRAMLVPVIQIIFYGEDIPVKR